MIGIGTVAQFISPGLNVRGIMSSSVGHFSSGDIIEKGNEIPSLVFRSWFMS
jgi:hypothetical protein